MDAIARAIAGSAILFAGVIFTLYGALYGFDGIPALLGFAGIALDLLALVCLLQTLGLITPTPRQPHPLELPLAKRPQ